MVLSTSADRDQYERSTLSALALPFWRLGEGRRRAAKVGPRFRIRPVTGTVSNVVHVRGCGGSLRRARGTSARPSGYKLLRHDKRAR